MENYKNLNMSNILGYVINIFYPCAKLILNTNLQYTHNFQGNLKKFYTYFLCISLSNGMNKTEFLVEY